MKKPKSNKSQIKTKKKLKLKTKQSVRVKKQKNLLSNKATNAGKQELTCTTLLFLKGLRKKVK